jgi:hypothetical protein
MEFHNAVLREILEERVPPRNYRHIPRCVKRRVAHYQARTKDYCSAGFKAKPSVVILN